MRDLEPIRREEYKRSRWYNSKYCTNDILISKEMMNMMYGIFSVNDVNERIYKTMKELVKVVQVNNPNLKQKVAKLDNDKNQFWMRMEMNYMMKFLRMD